MFSQVAISYLHYLAIFGVISALVAEAFIFKPVLTLKDRKLLQRADSIYGISALLVLVTGFMRVFFFGKGSEYYFSNSLFLAKLGLFIVVGVLSIYPTIVFLKWRKITDNELALTGTVYLTIRRMLILEICIVLILPLLATMMARGIGV